MPEVAPVFLIQIEDRWALFAIAGFCQVLRVATSLDEAKPSSVVRSCDLTHSWKCRRRPEVRIYSRIGENLGAGPPGVSETTVQVTDHKRVLASY